LIIPSPLITAEHFQWFFVNLCVRKPPFFNQEVKMKSKLSSPLVLITILVLSLGSANNAQVYQRAEHTDFRRLDPENSPVYPLGPNNQEIALLNEEPQAQNVALIWD
jgi:hypothetical protein